MDSNNLLQQQPITTPNTVQGVSQIQSVPFVQQPMGTIQNQQTAQPTGYLSQEQVNSIVANRVNALNQKITELSAQLTQANQLSTTYANQVADFQRKETLVNEGVPDYLRDYVSFEASKLAVNGKSFADAVKEFKSANTNLFNTSVTGVNAQGTTQQTPVVAPNASVGSVANTTPTSVAQQTLGLQTQAVTAPQPQVPTVPQNLANPLQTQQIPQGIVQQPQLQPTQPVAQQNNYVSTGLYGNSVNPNGQTLDVKSILDARFKVRQ